MSGCQFCHLQAPYSVTSKNHILIKLLGSTVFVQNMFTFSHSLSLSLLSPPDLISKLMDSASDPWLENENCYNLVSVPETYTGPRLSFPLSVSDMNALLGAFKEQQVWNMSLLKLNCLVFVFRISGFSFPSIQDATCQICSAAAARDQKAP